MMLSLFGFSLLCLAEDLILIACLELNSDVNSHVSMPPIVTLPSITAWDGMVSDDQKIMAHPQGAVRSVVNPRR